MQFQRHSVRRCFTITQTLFATPPHLHQTIIIRTRFYRVLFLFGGSARRCRAACGVNPFGLTASEERSKRLHLRKSSAADIANDCAICRTNAQHCCLQQIVERRRSFLRYFVEKAHTSKRVSIIAPDNAISKAQCATLLRYYANVVCYAPPHLHQRRSPMNLETPSTPVLTSRQTSRKIKKDLSLRISLIISNKTGVCARVSGFITPRVKGADYSLICLPFIIIARYRQIFLISRTRKSQKYVTSFPCAQTLP